MKEVISHSFIYIFFLFFISKEVDAASVSYSPLLTQVFSNTDEISIKASLSISAPDDSSYYLRGVFYKDGSSNYCGLTWNGTSFYRGPYTTNEGWKNFLKVGIKDSQWEGEVKVKIDSEDSGCKDSGQYLFKIERFTESGSGSFDSQDALGITFILPSPTQIPTPTAKPTATPHITPVSKTATPTKSSTISPSQRTATSNIQAENSVSNSDITPNPYYLDYKSSDGAVLSEATTSADEHIKITPTPILLVMKSSGKIASSMAVLSSIIGGVLLVLCAILAIRIYKRNT